ncbi:MAG: rhodanese-like domain-containing protein [Desulfomicrobium sp.]
MSACLRLRATLRLVTVAVLLLMGGCLEQDVRLLDPAAAVEIMRQNKDNPAFVILDVRTEQEFRQGYIQGAALLDYYAPDFRERFAELDRDATIFTYCRSGNRSSHVLKMADDLGFRNVYDLRGGILAWREAGLPLSK